MKWDRSVSCRCICNSQCILVGFNVSNHPIQSIKFISMFDKGRVCGTGNEMTEGSSKTIDCSGRSCTDFPGINDFII